MLACLVPELEDVDGVVHPERAVGGQRASVVTAASSNPPPRDSFTFAELFAGIGGFRIGLEALGGRCVFVSEIDPKQVTQSCSSSARMPSLLFTSILASLIWGAIMAYGQCLWSGLACLEPRVAPSLQRTRCRLFPVLSASVFMYWVHSGLHPRMTNIISSSSSHNVIRCGRHAGVSKPTRKTLVLRSKFWETYGRLKILQSPCTMYWWQDSHVSRSQPWGISLDWRMARRVAGGCYSRRLCGS